MVKDILATLAHWQVCCAGLCSGERRGKTLTAVSKRLHTAGLCVRACVCFHARFCLCSCFMLPVCVSGESLRWTLKTQAACSPACHVPCSPSTRKLRVWGLTQTHVGWNVPAGPQQPPHHHPPPTLFFNFYRPGSRPLCVSSSAWVMQG